MVVVLGGFINLSVPKSREWKVHRYAGVFGAIAGGYDSQTGPRSTALSWTLSKSVGGTTVQLSNAPSGEL